MSKYSQITLLINCQSQQFFLRKKRYSVPRGNCNHRLENGRLQMGHFKTGHFEMLRFSCFELQRLDLTHL